MSGRATWRGMDLYRQALLGFPPAIAEEAGEIFAAHARAAFAAMYAAYPVITGELRGGLQIADDTPHALHPRWKVWNDTFYAKIFEAGGATLAGMKPQGRVFVPIAIRERRAARTEVVEMMLRLTPHG